MTIYSMPFFIYSWRVWCLRTFHQLCHQVVFPKWRTGVLWVPAVIYLSFWKHDCSIYPYGAITPKSILWYLLLTEGNQASNMRTHMTNPLPLCRCLEQQELPIQITYPELRNLWQLPKLRDPGRFPQAQQSLGWITVFEHLCKNKYGLIPACSQYIPLKMSLQAWSLISFRVVPGKTCNYNYVTTNNII